MGGSWLYPDSLVATALVDYEMGGTALNDGSAGLLVQPWACWADGTGDVYIRPLHSPESPTLLFSAPGITEVTFAFDRNMQVAVAYQVAGVVSLRWYDATVPGYVVTELPGIRNPKLTHDDKRDTASASSDVILAYLTDTSLKWRQQRDRYLIEYDWADGILPSLRLKLIGMNRLLRLQAEFERIT